MSDHLDELGRAVSGWSAPQKDLPNVLRRGRRLAWRRRAFAGGLAGLTLLGALMAYSAADEPETISPASSNFDLLDAAARMNGVDLEPTEIDDQWFVARNEARRPEESMLPEGPISVLATSEKLGRGMVDRRAWADLVDGWAPGPVRLDGEEEVIPRVYLTLTFMGGGVAHLPVAPPYEDFGEIEGSTLASETAEPWPLWADLEWEGVNLEHPANWGRVALGYSPGGSVTEIATLSISNVATWPIHGDGFDMSSAPSDAVIVEVRHSEGGPLLGTCTLNEDCEADTAERGTQQIDASGARSGTFYVGPDQVWFWVGPDASPAEEAASERILESFGSGPLVIERPSPGPDAEGARERCRGEDARRADVDGDGEDELVYHAWVKGSAQVGVCFDDGRFSGLHGLGQAESFIVLPDPVTGRDILAFGATAMTETVHRFAMWHKNRLIGVFDRDARGGPLAALTGTDLESGVGTAWVWNCDVAGELNGTLVQVEVRSVDGGLRWSGTGYDFTRGRFAREVSSAGGVLEGGDPEEAARKLTEKCAPPSV